MPAFLEIPNFILGKPLKVEVYSVEFGHGRSIDSPIGNSSNAPRITEIHLIRLMDEYTPHFYQEALVGKPRAMTIYMVDGNAKTVNTYLTIKLGDAMISGYRVNKGGSDPMESISLNFTKMEQKYDPIKV